MTYQGPQGQNVNPGANSHVPNMKYAYDIAVQGGRCMTTHRYVDVSADSAFEPCRSPWGATVVTAAGGVVRGYDYLGQYIEVPLSAATPSLMAFMRVTAGPPDTLFVNGFGLPYLRVSGGATGLTFVIAAPTADARGLVTYDTPPAEGTETPLDYVADMTNLHGDPYAERFATPAVMGGSGGGAPTEPETHGPYNYGTTSFWLHAMYGIGFNLDDDSEADAWFSPADVAANADLKKGLKTKISAKLVDHGMPPLPEGAG